MSYHDSFARAEATIAAAEAGAYDEQLGISAEQRDVLTRAKGDGALSLDDIRTLNQMGHQALTAAAYEAGRITLNNEEN